MKDNGELFREIYLLLPYIPMKILTPVRTDPGSAVPRGFGGVTPCGTASSYAARATTSSIPKSTSTTVVTVNSSPTRTTTYPSSVARAISTTIPYSKKM